MSDINCPFYGRHMFLPGIPVIPGIPGRGQSPFLLIDQGGNQCGLIVGAYTPCLLETNGEFIDWRKCPVVKDVRMERT